MELAGSGDDDVGMTMVHPMTSAPVLVERQTGSPEEQPFWITNDQLHGQACIRCEHEGGQLRADGHVYTPTRPHQAALGWPVSAHPGCLKEDQ